MRRTLPSRSTLVGVALLTVASCARDETTGPPDIEFGASVCAECNMIISDERFASAVIVRTDRGVESLLFDDIGDQVRHERTNPDLTVLARWTHDHGTREWIPAESAVYVHSKDLHTPMASGIAAFANRSAAEALHASVGGEIVTFDELWKAD